MRERERGGEVAHLILSLHHWIRSQPLILQSSHKKASKSETSCREIQVGWGMGLSSPSDLRFQHSPLRIPAARDDELHQNKMQKIQNQNAVVRDEASALGKHSPGSNLHFKPRRFHAGIQRRATIVGDASNFGDGCESGWRRERNPRKRR